jgi:hypothetical protein
MATWRSPATWAGLKPILAIPMVGAIYIAIVSLALNLLISLGGSLGKGDFPLIVHHLDTDKLERDKGIVAIRPVIAIAMASAG